VHQHPAAAVRAALAEEAPEGCRIAGIIASLPTGVVRALVCTSY
jgi:hypothetical protein